MDAIPASKPDATPVNDDPAPGPEQRPQPATSSITNVAAMAHVSIATVSRVLSGKRTKDDDIARRVRAAAEELNYSVNYAASCRAAPPPTPSDWSSLGDRPFQRRTA